MNNPMKYSGEQIYIRPFEQQDANALHQYRLDNREFLSPFEPVRPETHFTLTFQDQSIFNSQKEWKQDLAYVFGIFHQENHQLIGQIALRNIVRGAWQNATLGYSIGEAWNGRGFASEAVRLVTTFAFHEAHLHRVQAAVMPRNERSIRVLEKNHFLYEGYSPKYLNINGVWEDHKVFSKINEEF